MPDYTRTNKENLQRAQLSVLSAIQYMSKRSEMMSTISYCIDSRDWPECLRVPDNMYDYSAYNDVYLYLKFPEEYEDDSEESWRYRAKQIADARKYLNIKTLVRSVNEEGTVWYTGKGKLPFDDSKERDFTLRIEKGGLPPTCKIVVEEKEVTQIYKQRTVKTECGPRHVSESVSTQA